MPHRTTAALERTSLVHLLTKLFFVLVALLAVMLTPLVAVNAVNDASIKDKLADMTSKKNALDEALKASDQIRMASDQAYAVQTKELEMRLAEVQRSFDSAVADATRLQGELADARSGQEDIRARIGIMAQTQEAQQRLGETLVEELRSLRTRAVAAERQSVDLEEELGIVRSQLEIAQAARRALQEEVQQLNDERDAAMDTIARYVAYIGELPSAAAGAATGTSPRTATSPRRS